MRRRNHGPSIMMCLRIRDKTCASACVYVIIIIIKRSIAFPSLRLSSATKNPVDAEQNGSQIQRSQGHTLHSAQSLSHHRPEKIRAYVHVQLTVNSASSFHITVSLLFLVSTDYHIFPPLLAVVTAEFFRLFCVVVFFAVKI